MIYKDAIKLGDGPRPEWEAAKKSNTDMITHG